MTHDADLRAKLDSLAPDLELGAPTEAIMKRGRRRRVVWQSLISGGAAAAVAAITATSVVLSGHHAATRTAQTAGARGAAPAANPTCGVNPQPTDGAPPASNDGSSAAPWGDPMVGPSGVPGVQMTVTAFHIGGMPCTNVGFEFSLHSSGGSVANLQATNEFDGSDIAPGFHATGLSTVADGWYIVGYYAGPAASISLSVNGQSVNANLTSWSVNPNVKVWWVHGTGQPPSSAQPTALDVAGKPLPAGAHATQLGVG